MSVLLETKDLNVRFGGVHAARDVNFALNYIASPSQRVLAIKRGRIAGEIPREHLSDLDMVSEYTGMRNQL